MSGESTEKVSKFTRGDKCILIHIAVTSLLLFILAVIFIAHLLVVKHKGLDAFRVTRRNLEQLSQYDAVELRKGVPAYSWVGVAFVASQPPRLACNCLLVRQRWSLAPAHCLAARSEPELAQLLPNWRLRYSEHGRYKETDIKRSVAHSYYNKDDFGNNIGLFEHMDNIQIPELTFPDKAISDTLKSTEEDLAIVGWSKIDEISSTPVRLLNHSICSQFVTPIVESPREFELCVSQAGMSNIDGVHGGAFILKSQLVGFFSWGDRSGNVPQVVLLVEPYRPWLESIISMNM